MTDLNITREEFYALYKKAKLNKYKKDKAKQQEIERYRHENYCKVMKRKR